MGSVYPMPQPSRTSWSQPPLLPCTHHALPNLSISIPKFRSLQEIPSSVEISEDKMTENCWQSHTGAKHTRIIHSSWKISTICTLGNCIVFRYETNHYLLEIFPTDTVSPWGFLSDLKPLAARTAGISVLWGVSGYHSSIRKLGNPPQKARGFVLFSFLPKILLWSSFLVFFS